MFTAQDILNVFPDAISDYGLLGCFTATLIAVYALTMIAALLAYATRKPDHKPAMRGTAYRDQDPHKRPTYRAIGIR